MNIQQLRKYWQDNGVMLRVCSPSPINHVGVDSETFTFLTTCGLPAEAPPFLMFGGLWANELVTPNQYFQLEFEGLNGYLVFGCNGSGDPICIDITNSNEIVYLNHDNDFERIFMNSNIVTFAACVARYHDFIVSLIVKENGGFARRKFTDDEFKQLKHVFESIDSDALSSNSFWSSVLDNLIWERDNE